MEIKSRIELVKLLPEDSHVAELGVAEGLFSRELLASGVKTLIMVDNWGHIPNVTGDGNFPDDWHRINFETAKENVRIFGERAIIKRGLTVDVSRQIPENYLDMVYLDAGHYYSAVLSDLIAWYPKVKKGGIVSGHDYLNSDYQVKEAVDEFLRMNKISTEPKVILENNFRDASFYFVKQ